MRIPPLALPLLVLATGCATTSTPRKTAAQRAEEIARYREKKKAAEEGADEQEQAGGQAEKPAEPTAPAASTPPEAPTPPAAPASATGPVAPAVPQGPIGPRAGLFGLRATLLGSTLPLDESAATSSMSTLGIRYFVGDSLGVNLSGGFTYGSTGEASLTALSLGLGLNIYAGAQNEPLRPFFALEGALSQLGTKAGTVEQSASVVALSAGGGAEYWLTPRLSVSASLMLGLATVPGTEEDEEATFVLGTFQPGLGVTLYTN
jgi:hypothetical protein